MISIFLENLFFILDHPLFMLIAISCSLSVKLYWMQLLGHYGVRSKPLNKPWIFLIGVLLGSLFGDLAWAVKIIQLYMPEIPYAVVVFFIRISWAMLIVQYQSLSLFIASLPEKNYHFSLRQKYCIAFSSFCSLYFLYIAFFESSLTNFLNRNSAFFTVASTARPLEVYIMQFAPFYLLPILIVPSLFVTLKKLQTNNLPNILKKQLNALLLFLVCPYLLTEILGAINACFYQMQTHQYTVESLSILLFTYLVYYSIQRVMSLRFLNFHNTVQSYEQFNTVNNVKLILEQLSHATSLEELGQISRTFFKNAYGISTTKVHLCVRAVADAKESLLSPISGTIANKVEDFLTNSPYGARIFEKHAILVKDEIAFSTFYHQSTSNTVALDFLEQIDADIFIPIYGKKVIVAYLMVNKKSRPRKLYTQTEQDEMFVFANYLGKVIHLLQHRNVTTMLQQEKLLTEELYHKHQEINQYKESMHALLRNHHNHDVGVLLYAHGRFSFANQAAHTLLPFNPNGNEQSPLLAKLKHVTAHATTYQSPEKIIAENGNGQKIVIEALPHKETGGAIIMLKCYEVIDLIAKQIEDLKNPSNRDYLFYLQTTRSGKLINTMMPGSGPALLNFKIALLETALSKKPLLLEMPEADVLEMAELIHHISLRERFELFDAKHTDAHQSMYYNAQQLFGINPIFGIEPTMPPLLEQLDGVGTLCIRNIDQLDLESQEYLAEYLKYGFFRVFKGNQKITSDVRIICWTRQHLPTRVQEGSFSAALYQELKKGTVSLPSLLTLPEKEVQEITQGFIEQERPATDLSSSSADAARIMHTRPASLHELREKVRSLLKQKIAAPKEYLAATTTTISDAELLDAINLGKKALKNRTLMIKLWDKFQNQNKIATFLGVNRSSVNRRCKEYNLQ